MKSFRGKLAVVTGGGTGMGRELARQLAAEGCHVALCDVSAENMAETRDARATPRRRPGTRVTHAPCDVADERRCSPSATPSSRSTDRPHQPALQQRRHRRRRQLLIDDRAEWERTFGVCWGGVYYCTRAFLPLLIASNEGYIINTSSVNGFWACLGPSTAHTAYSAAKFAVKGFTEALIVDLRLNAPHVKVARGHARAHRDVDRREHATRSSARPTIADDGRRGLARAARRCCASAACRPPR